MRNLAGQLPSLLQQTLTISLILESLVPATYGQQARTANDRIYTESQASRGRALYQEKCATCHGAALEGKVGPQLAGTAFLNIWGSQPLSELASKIQNTMPAGDPGKLKPSETADLLSYILQVSKFPSGNNELGAGEAGLKSLVLNTARPIVAVGVQAPQPPPLGNLAQVMRGILFPSSNIIFNVQGNDPGAAAKPGQAGAGTTTGFSWTDWGAGIYTGWQIVDYAAVAIAESAPLLLTPGRRCENGKPVPVDRPDWIKFSQELAEAGRVAYRASQSRSQEAVSDATSQVADACLHCHQIYRDKPNSRLGDPSASAAHCTP
jgi:mono/diheme cytochrome c family protein